jgi:hypothetical protein
LRKPIYVILKVGEEGERLKSLLIAQSSLVRFYKYP